MEELVHDLASALEESEQIKVDVEEESPVEEDHYRKRRIRKRRPTCLSTAPNNVVLLCGNGPTMYRGSDKNLPSGSDTENGFVLPSTVRKHRRKKIKHMEIDCRCDKKGMKNLDKKTMEVESTNTLEDKLPIEEESGLSASEDSNDEDIDGQDGDDEMTDFYNESGGSVCGIPSIIPWWDDGVDNDSKLKSIISNAIPYLSEAGQRGFHARINRLPGMAARSIRRNRRRHKIKKTIEKNGSASERTELKIFKRRKTENMAEDMHELKDVEISSVHLPIPDTNAGHKMLLSMGWKPGEGLGRNKQGIQNPISSTKRNKRVGLGL